MGTTYQIAEVAERSGFTPATLRYYEDIGLVTPAGRTVAGYRLYDEASLRRLRFVARAKQLGCSLDEIAELSAAWDGGRCAHVQERLRATVAAKIASSHRRIAEIALLTADLQRAAAALAGPAPAGPCDDTCACTTDSTDSTDSAAAGPAAAPSTVSAVPLTAKAADAGAAAPAAATAAGVPGDATDGCGDGCGCGPLAGADAGADAGPPIACTLDAAAMGGRVDAWAALLGSTGDLDGGVVARSAIDDGVRLTFGPGTDVAEVARLAAAERDCCRFFRFALVIDARGIALEVRAPADAADAVTALFGAPA